MNQKTFKKLRKIVGAEHCSRDKEDLACYSYDATTRTYLPDAVVFPGNSGDISSILKLASENGFFVIPRGSGTGMTGGALAVNGGVILSLARLNRIIQIDRRNMVAHVEPGVITGDFHREVEEIGLFYPPDPSSSNFSTLGGNLAECAGGPRAVKYGVTRDYVLGLEAVLPTGEIIKTGVQTTKGVVGYDLTRLLIGSEGTLGVITRIILRLLPLPQLVRTMTATFDHIESAAQTVSGIISRSIIPRTIEFMDDASLRCVDRHLQMGLPDRVRAMLLIQVDGNAHETENEMVRLTEICQSHGAVSIQQAKTGEETEKLWKARKALSPALFTYGPHKINEDIVVPRSKIPDMVKKIDELRQEFGLMMVCFGHAGDGNIHFNIMLDKNDPDELNRAEKAVEILFDHTLSLGGTISGEHGVGITKAPYLEKEIGAIEIQLMKKIKRVFDPSGVLNPGKIFSMEDRSMDRE